MTFHILQDWGNGRTPDPDRIHAAVTQENKNLGTVPHRQKLANHTYFKKKKNGFVIVVYYISTINYLES